MVKDHGIGLVMKSYLSYNNTVAQCDNNGNCGDAAPGRVHLRLNLSDYGDIADPSITQI